MISDTLRVAQVYSESLQMYISAIRSEALVLRFECPMCDSRVYTRCVHSYSYCGHVWRDGRACFKPRPVWDGVSVSVSLSSKMYGLERILIVYV